MRQRPRARNPRDTMASSSASTWTSASASAATTAAMPSTPTSACSTSASAPLSAASFPLPPPRPPPSAWGFRAQWIGLAIASGACAAFNGVFAKLTTTDLTASIAGFIARMTGLSYAERLVELLLRAIFFALNLVFNAIMWMLFTSALAKGSSTTKVSIVNTSTNFVLTALLGLAIFSESLPSLWWVGAALLVAGNVIIGSKDDKLESQTPSDAALDIGYTVVDADEYKHLLRSSIRSLDLADEDVPHLESPAPEADEQ